MKSRRNRLILIGFALVIVGVGLLVLVPYLREYEWVRRVTISEAARDLPEVVARIMRDNVGIGTNYTVTDAQRAPNPQGYFEGPGAETWCITVNPPALFTNQGPQKNFIAIHIGELRDPSLLTYDSGWILYYFEVNESMFEAIGCSWAD